VGLRAEVLLPLNRAIDLLIAGLTTMLLPRITSLEFTRLLGLCYGLLGKHVLGRLLSLEYGCEYLLARLDHFDSKLSLITELQNEESRSQCLYVGVLHHTVLNPL
jgi:hypothetical protein